MNFLQGHKILAYKSREREKCFKKSRWFQLAFALLLMYLVFTVMGGLYQDLKLGASNLSVINGKVVEIQDSYIWRRLIY